MSKERKPIVWAHGQVKTPPFSPQARLEAGFLLGRLQNDENLGLPHSRPMPGIGAHCHGLRITDTGRSWRIIYRVDSDAVMILEVFAKTTRATPKAIVDICKQRIRRYENETS